VDGSRPVRSRRCRHAPRALIVFQSAIPCRTPIPRRRRHGRHLPRKSPLHKILKTNTNKKPIFTKLLEPYTRRRAATRFCIRTTHEAMGQRRRRCQPHPPWSRRWTRKRKWYPHRYRHRYGWCCGRCSSHGSSPTWLSYGRGRWQAGEEAPHQCYRHDCHRRSCAQDGERVVGCCGSAWAIRCMRFKERKKNM
jgi:hypothetical protein